MRKLFHNRLLLVVIMLVSMAHGFSDEHAAPPSFHVLISTIGRPALLNMLNSLKPQLEERDFLTVVFDARDDGKIFQEIERFLASFQCQCTLIMEPENLGHWGHAIRNKHNKLPGDFILHGDDDDIYLPGAFATMRNVCTDTSTLYIFKISNFQGVIMSGYPLVEGNIGTPMGVIPSQYNSQSTWMYRYGGDFVFYHQLAQIIPRISYVDAVIYQCRP